MRGGDGVNSCPHVTLYSQMIFSPPLYFPLLPLHLFNLIFVSSIPLSYPYLIIMLLSKQLHVLLGLKNLFSLPKFFLKNLNALNSKLSFPNPEPLNLVTISNHRPNLSQI